MKKTILLIIAICILFSQCSPHKNKLKKTLQKISLLDLLLTINPVSGFIDHHTYETSKGSFAIGTISNAGDVTYYLLRETNGDTLEKYPVSFPGEGTADLQLKSAFDYGGVTKLVFATTSGNENSLYFQDIFVTEFDTSRQSFDLSDSSGVQKYSLTNSLGGYADLAVSRPLNTDSTVYIFALGFNTYTDTYYSSDGLKSSPKIQSTSSSFFGCSDTSQFQSVMICGGMYFTGYPDQGNSWVGNTSGLQIDSYSSISDSSYMYLPGKANDNSTIFLYSVTELTSNPHFSNFSLPSVSAYGSGPIFANYSVGGNEVLFVYFKDQNGFGTQRVFNSQDGINWTESSSSHAIFSRSSTHAAAFQYQDQISFYYWETTALSTLKKTTTKNGTDYTDPVSGSFW